jgi:hypothetical protein
VVEEGSTTDVVTTPLASAWIEFNTVGVDCNETTTHSKGVNPEYVSTTLSPGENELSVKPKVDGSALSTEIDGGAMGKILIELEEGPEPA